jgi:hypothetical protein
MTSRDWVFGYGLSVQLSGIIYKGPVGRAKKIALFLDYFTLKGGSDMLAQNVCNRPTSLHHVTSQKNEELQLLHRISLKPRVIKCCSFCGGNSEFRCYVHEFRYKSAYLPNFIVKILSHTWRNPVLTQRQKYGQTCGERIRMTPKRKPTLDSGAVVRSGEREGPD